MDRIRRFFERKPAYEPLANDTRDSSDNEPPRRMKNDDFSWLEYTIFLLLGVAMLWAWYEP
jgi:solute carrier family 29 (equilibrative nucleoside transporter), member 1/2/3